jgi:hypothetical protein
MNHESFVEGGYGTQKKSELSPSEYHVDRFLDTIDHDVLGGIMDELLGRSDIERSPEHEIDSAVEFDETRKASGWHNSGKITINAAKFDFNEDYKKDYRRILSTYIHEYVHANALGPGADNETGFQYVSEDEKKHHAPLNEGFTELIADYVYEEYVRRSGERERLGQTSHRRTVKGYLQERADAMALVRKISEEAGIPEDVVLGAYIRAYFSQDVGSLENSL